MRFGEEVEMGGNVQRGKNVINAEGIENFHGKQQPDVDGVSTRADGQSYE